MPFLHRKIDLTFKLGTGNFGESGLNTVKVSGMRVHASVANPGVPSMGVANVRIFGLTLSLMNQLSNVIRDVTGQVGYRFNQMLIEAGDDERGMSLIFQGQMSLSQVDMSAMPDASLVVVAHAGLLEALKPAAAQSYPGSADAAVIMKNLAMQSNYAFENNGVSVMLATPYFSGSVRDQMIACATAANINWVIESGVLAIWPKGGSRGGMTPVVSAETGMRGYPTNNGLGVDVTSVFNSQIESGRNVEVKSSLPFANGKFTVFGLGHELQSETPNGAWFSHFSASPYNVGS